MYIFLISILLCIYIYTFADSICNNMFCVLPIFFRFWPSQLCANLRVEFCMVNFWLLPYHHCVELVDTSLWTGNIPGSELWFESYG